MRLTLDKFHILIDRNEKIKGLLRLTRWREHVPFTIPLTIVGAMLAVSLNGLALDWRLFAIAIANVMAMSFAFMINDVEDAPDDALDPKKSAHNVVSSGILTPREGTVASALTFLVALLLYGLGGIWAFALGALTLLLCYLYSAHPFRLKARPITDVLSHALMLSGLLVMTGYFTYHNDPGVAWYIILAATFFSAYGQFYQQIADYIVDKEAGLKNTVVLLGKTRTSLLMYGAVIGALICLLLAIFSGAFPAWLGTVLLIAAGVCSLFIWETDMRGNAADLSGALQKPVLLIFNILMIMWVVKEFGMLSV